MNPDQNCLVFGNILTMDPERPVAQAMAISKGRIIAVGSIKECGKIIEEPCTRHDYRGKTVLPGLIDSHNHMYGTGLQKSLLDLSHCESIHDILDAIHSYASANPHKEWIVGAQGWQIDSIKERRYPTRYELDQVSPNRPVFLPRIYHAAAANSLALKLANLTRETPDPTGGRIVRDERGELTGELRESPAFWPIEALLPPLSQTEKASALLSIQNEYLGLGICGVIDPGLTSDELALYRQIKAEGKLRVRTVAMPLAPTAMGKNAVSNWLKKLGARTGSGDSQLKLGGIKVFLDGGASLGTALMREPYPGTKCNCGIQVTDTETFRLIAHYCGENGWSLGVHTVGGKAIDLALQVFREVDSKTPIRDLRFSLIHAYLWPSKENIRQARELGVAVATQASMQYQFAPGLTSQFGRDPIARATPIRSWIDGGVLVAGGSDAPTIPANPFLGMWHSTTRYVDALQEALGLDQAISRQEALELYTTKAAWLSFSEHERGALKPGLVADWIVVDHNPLECSQEQLKRIQVLDTAVGGLVVHRTVPPIIQA